MKKSIIFYAFLLLTSCNTTAPDNPEGVYTAEYEHEFAKTEDTLQLKKLTEPGNSFQIARHSGVTKKTDDKIFPKENINEVWNLEYDNDKKTFTELKGGKTLVWNPDKKVLILGSREYIREK